MAQIFKSSTPGHFNQIVQVRDLTHNRERTTVLCLERRSDQRQKDKNTLQSTGMCVQIWTGAGNPHSQLSIVQMAVQSQGLDVREQV